MMVRFICEDDYEADKLSSMFTLQKDNSLFVMGIVKTIGKEVIVNLKDGSHHSISFKDTDNALKFEKMFMELSSTKGKIISVRHSGNAASFNLDWSTF
jgi:hypothetical protein